MKPRDASLLMFLVVAVAVTNAGGQTNPKPSDPCAFLTKAEAAAVMGEVKGEPTPKDGLRGRKCVYDNIKGAWISIAVYPAEAHWDLVKNMANDVQELSDLGEAAFSAKRGDTRQVYVKKGATMIEVDSSAGIEAAQKAAAIAVKRLP